MWLEPIFQLPRRRRPAREVLQLPLLEHRRRPAAELRCLLDLGLGDHAQRCRAPPVLGRRRADQIDIFRLAGHKLVSSRNVREDAVSALPINGDLPRSLKLQGAAYRHSLMSTKWPAIAAAAAIAGDTRWV